MNVEILLILSLIFAPLAFASVEPWALGILQIAAFSAVVFLLMRPRPFYGALTNKNILLAILAVALLGLLQAVHENPINAPSMLLFTTWRPATLNAVLLWLFYAAVLFSIPQLIKTPGQFKRLMWVVFGMGVVISLFGMLQKTGNPMVYGLRLVKGDPFGPYVNRDHAALFLIMSAMAGSGIFFCGFKDLFAHQSRKRFFDLAAIQFLKAVMLCAVVYGVVKTGSRGGLHSLVAAASVMACISTSFIKAKTPRYTARGFIVLLLAGYGILLYNNRLLLGFDNGVLVSSVTVRFSLYQSGLEMFKDFPLFGAGLGAVEHGFPYYQLKNWGLVRHIHGDWLELFLQAGLFGGLIYLTGLIAALRKFFHIWVKCPSFTTKSLYGGGLGALLAASLHNFVEFGSQMPANALYFYVLMGALASKPAVESRKFSYDAEEEDEAAPLKRSIALPAAAAACLLMFFTIPPAIGWWYDFRAKDAPYEKKVLYRAEALKWAPSPRYAFRLGADYYNQALKNKPEARDLFNNSLQSIEPYLLRVPVNTDLTLLKNNILAHLYVRPPNRPALRRSGRPSTQLFNLSNP